MISSSYDAESQPGEDWLELDEKERLARVRAYHEALQGSHPPTPNPQAHYFEHVAIENQLSANHPQEVRITFERLRGSGADRHDALHALGSVFMTRIAALARRGTTEFDDAAYVETLRNFTLKTWLEPLEAQAKALELRALRSPHAPKKWRSRSKKRRN